MSRKIEFVWGPGGVGKSHMAIREAALSNETCLLITLDPSPRIFDLMGLSRKVGIQTAVLTGSPEQSYQFDVKATDAVELFKRLQERTPANETVKWYFNELVNGLQEFRDYLSLIELATDVESGDYQKVIIDTPPFHEAVGLHKSILTLREFFDRSLVQFALRKSILNVGIRKLIDITKLFVGAGAVEQTVEFLDWLSLHLDRFQKASKNLEEMVFAPQTFHKIVLTPESPHRYVEEMQHFFKQTQHLGFQINRSSWGEKLPDTSDSFVREVKNLQSLEKNLFQQLQASFPQAEISRLPYELMGDDTESELIDFIELKSLENV